MNEPGKPQQPNPTTEDDKPNEELLDEFVFAANEAGPCEPDEESSERAMQFKAFVRATKEPCDDPES